MNQLIKIKKIHFFYSSLCWKANGNEDGISIPWRKISVHAISTTPQRCVYLMLDFLLIWPGITDQRNGNGHAAPEIQNGGNDDDDVDEDEGHVEGLIIHVLH